MTTSSTYRKRVLFKSSIDANTLFDVNIPYAEAKRRLGNNSGNLVFTKAIQHYLQEADADYTVADVSLRQLSKSDFDCCIVNCANWIEPRNKNLLQNLATELRGIKIPVYFIGLGIQASASESLSFINPIEKEVKQFIAAVLDSGGGFGLRGGFTAAVFEKLGFRDFSVIGCPSMYQRGSQLKVEKQDLARDELKPVVNGRIYSSYQLLSEFFECQTAEYICQDDFYRYLYCFDELSTNEKVALSGFPDPILRMILDRRLNLFYSIEHWIDYIRSKGLNYSFGSRIHGNIICILLGIPSLVHALDRRTQELAEHFAIPILAKQVRISELNLYELYQNTDYAAFNKGFSSRYAEFCAFIAKHNLPLKPGRDWLADVSLKSIERREQSDLAELIEDILAFDPGPLLRFINPDRQFWRKLKIYLSDKFKRKGSLVSRSATS